MIKTEAYVGGRFDAVASRFRAELEPEDFRLQAILSKIDLRVHSRILDLGCGKGRFALALMRRGFAVVGMDLSAGMLASARSIQRLRGTARRLPFAGDSFDAVMAVEVFEHLDTADLDRVLDEMARVLRPGGKAVILDKNSWSLDARRPWLPSAVVKGIDERRGKWMYPHDAPFREQWFRSGALKARMARRFASIEVDFPLSPAESQRVIHRRLPGSRLHILWTAIRPEGDSLD